MDKTGFEGHFREKKGSRKRARRSRIEFARMSSDKGRPDPRMNLNGRVEGSTTCGSSPFVHQPELEPRFDSEDAIEWETYAGDLEKVKSYVLLRVSFDSHIQFWTKVIQIISLLKYLKTLQNFQQRCTLEFVSVQLCKHGFQPGTQQPYFAKLRHFVAKPDDKNVPQFVTKTCGYLSPRRNFGDTERLVGC